MTIAEYRAALDTVAKAWQGDPQLLNYVADELGRTLSVPAADLQRALARVARGWTTTEH